MTDNGKVFTGKLMNKPGERDVRSDLSRQRDQASPDRAVLADHDRQDRTAAQDDAVESSSTTTCSTRSKQTQAALDGWVIDYNTVREHQSIGDVAPIRRFELAKPANLEVIDGDVTAADEPEPPKRTVTRRVDSAGRISILKHRYHVGRHLAGEPVEIQSSDGLLHVTHNGVVVATHARRHLVEDDDKMAGRGHKANRPSAPTKGGEVVRGVDSSGSLSFAGTAYRVGNKFIGRQAGVRIVGDTLQITIDGVLIRTHKARHDKSKEFGALAQPHGKPRRDHRVA